MEGTGRVGMWVRTVGGKVVQEGWRALSACSSPKYISASGLRTKLETHHPGR